MSILILGMEMPKDREINLRIDEKGEVYVYGSYPTELHKAVPVPPHGRLIDADAVQDEWYRLNFDRKITDGTLAYWNMQLSKAPTIIPADGNMDTDFWGEEYAEAKGLAEEGE